MSDIHIEKNHSFDFETARAQAKKWLESAHQEFGLDVNYSESADQDTATIKKSGVEAVATLTADTVVFDAKLAFLAKPLKGAIQSGIEDGLKKYFA
ncbi:MAG: polyhydroxyalkanoic acid system family protein [Moraxella sp.]|nr:polyhydroxyalkanoic acid system family protein [Moraxella sp.]